MSRVSMTRGLFLTERDTKLLYDCYSHVSLSISQIANRHFPGLAKSTVLNRLTKLRREGLLIQQHVGVALHQGVARNIGVVYQVTKKGLKLLKSRYPNEQLREAPLLLSTTTLTHDLLLTDTLSALEKRFSSYRFLLGRFLPQERRTKERIPDAVILDTEGRPTVAVELELTAKSSSRYREIILQYQLNSHFEKVLYVVGDEGIFNKIKYQITQQKEVPGLKNPSTGKFYFCLLRQTLNDPTHTSMSNGLVELTLTSIDERTLE